MKIAVPAVFILLLTALYVYFLGTPFVASVIGISPRAISLVSAFAVIFFGIAAMMIGKISAQRGQRE
jgi:hypothetical protein